MKTINTSYCLLLSSSFSYSKLRGDVMSLNDDTWG